MILVRKKQRVFSAFLQWIEVTEYGQLTLTAESGKGHAACGLQFFQTEWNRGVIRLLTGMGAPRFFMTDLLRTGKGQCHGILERNAGRI